MAQCRIQLNTGDYLQLNTSDFALLNKTGCSYGGVPEPKPKRGRGIRRFFWPQQNVIKIPHYFQFSFTLPKPLQRKTLRERMLSSIVSIPVVKQVTKMVSPKLAVTISQLEQKTVVQIPAQRTHLEIFKIQMTVTRQHVMSVIIRYNDTFLTNDPLLDAIIMDDDVALANALENEET